MQRRLVILLLPAAAPRGFAKEFFSTGSQQEIPAFSLADVGGSAFYNVLREQGIAEITNVANLEVANAGALGSLATCGRQEGALDDGFFRKRLLDGSDRWTLAAGHAEASIVPERLREHCRSLEADLTDLRRILHATGDEVVRLMDSHFGGLETARQHGGFQALLTKGTTLEHFHLYGGGGQDIGEEALPLHTDSGAFLILTKALTFQAETRLPEGHRLLDEDSEGAKFIVQDRNGRLIAPRMAKSSVLVLMGDAMRDFLKAPTHSPVHTVDLRHMPGGAVRAWHGRMYLFPDNANNTDKQTAGSLFLSSLKTSDSANISYNERRLRRGRNDVLDGPLFKQPSSLAARRWLQSLKDDCKTKNAICWMQAPVCVEQCPDGTLQQCLLPDRSKGDCGPDVMDQKCAWRCANASIPDALGGFCNTKVATSMYMQGFTTTSSHNACVVLFFQGWVLDTRLKFVIGCIFVVFLGICTQGAIRLRSLLVSGRRKRLLKDKVVDSAMFGLNVVLGWTMMLVAMTYSVELFSCATLGLVVGNFAFAEASESKILGSPCCNAVNDSGFSRFETLNTLKLSVEGMTCSNCVETVEKAILRVEGTTHAIVLLSEKHAMVRFQQPATEQAIINAVEAVGFEPAVLSVSRQNSQNSQGIQLPLP